MSKPELAPVVEHFYSQVIDESTRLSMSADGRLELLRTQEILRRFLPPAPARILDIGGGPGIHARWLVEDGYQVELIDPVARHVEQAAKLCSAKLGDARQLPVTDAPYDVVLMLGPLYHLPDPQERRAALSEARRVVKPGGIVAVAAINRYASLFENVTTANLHTERMQASVSAILRTAIHDGERGFTLAYFHRAEELAEEVSGAGLSGLGVFGVEGPAWSLLKAVEQQPGPGPSEELFASVLAAARMAEPYAELLAASSHLLAIGRAPDNSI